MSARAWWIVVACLVCQLGLGTGYAVGPLAGGMIEELGWTRAMFSAGRLPQIWTISLVTPFIGVLLARFGPRALLTVAVTIIGTAFWLMGEIQSLPHYVALSVMFGIGLAGVGDVTVGAVLSRWVAERGRGFALGIAYTGSNLAGVLLSPLAGWIATEADGWRSAFHVIGGLALIVMVPVAVAVIRNPRRGEEVAEEIASPDAVVAGDRDLDLRGALGTPSFWLIGFSLFSFWFYFLGMLDHFVLFLEDVGFEKVTASGYYSFALGMGLVSKVTFGLVADRMRPRSAMLLNASLLAASTLLLLVVPRGGTLYPFLVVFGFSVAARDVIYPLLLGHCFGIRHLASIYGVLLLTLLPGTLGGVFNGFVFDAFGSYQPAFLTFAALNLVSFGALWFVRDERRGDGVRSTP